ncbi:MAG TPA: hypothetical protein VGE98_16620 [Thermoanaerobaculia bacterium]
MNVPSVLLWGLVATIVFTTCLALGVGLGLSRISLPLVLGAALSGDRRRANVIGFFAHMLLGFAFAFVYALCFESWRRTGWLLGAGMGVVHGVFVLAVLMPLLPSFHPRMASEDFGPNPTRQLEPPGFLALNYGRNTPLVTIAAHAIFGMILGAFYTLTPR